MAKWVRFTRDFDFWPSANVVVAHKAGQEKRLPQAQVDAAVKADAVEILDGAGRTNERPKRVVAKAGNPA